MNIPMCLYFLGWIMEFQGAFMLLPALTALICRESDGWWFLLISACMAILGTLCILKKPANKTMRAREGFAIVSFAWIIFSLTGALPYLLCGYIPNYIDCVFEAVSGFTTTGATILPPGTVFSYSMNLWHCFTIWIGGMGILVFMLAVLPMAGGETIHLMRAETPGPTVSKIVPKMRDSATILYMIYIGLTLLEMITLMISGLPFFDSLCMSLSNAGTGGFGVLREGFAGFTAAQETIFTVFMMLFAINFNVYFLILMKKPKEALLKNEELRMFLGLVVTFALVIAFNTRSLYGGFGKALHHSAFQVASLMSTTGFVSTDFALWPGLSQVLVVIMMFLGACAGSTCGGIKLSRYLILLKNSFKELNGYVRPRNVKIMKIDGKKVEPETVKSVQNYMFVYLLVFVASLILVSLVGNTSLTTAFTSVATTLNNVGPGLDQVGPTCNFAWLTGFQKIVLTCDMLIGRLELYPILLMFLPATWKKN